MISKAQLQNLISQATTFYANLNNQYNYQFRYGLAECLVNKRLMMEVLLYLWVLSTVQVYYDGTLIPDENYISQEDLTIMTDRLKLIIL